MIVHVGIYECKYMHAMMYLQRSENSLRCQSSSISTLFVIDLATEYTRWGGLQTSSAFPVSIFHLAIVLEL